MTEYRELHPIGTAARIAGLERANEYLAMRLVRLRAEQKGRKRASRRMWADPEKRAAILKAQRAALDERRGFKVPDHLQADYRNLLVKHYSAREAGKILGLI